LRVDYFTSQILLTFVVFVARNTKEGASYLTKSKLPEVDYCINPYIGCMHGCIYCYARFMKRFTNHSEEWGKFVDVKVNAVDVLEKELSRKPKRGQILLGSVTDAYQPAERSYGLTREILAVFLRYDFPISILTKSDLVTRDIDLLKQLCDCEVGLTITTFNEDASKKIEPLGSSPQKRIDALKLMHESGIKTYAFIGPILPGITELKSIFSKLKGNVDFVMAESMNTGCGNWDEMISLIKKNYPDLAEIYQSKFGNSYWDDIESEIKKLCLEFEIPLKGFYRHR